MSKFLHLLSLFETIFETAQKWSGLNTYRLLLLVLKNGKESLQ